MITIAIPDFWGGTIAGCLFAVLLMLALALIAGSPVFGAAPNNPPSDHPPPAEDGEAPQIDPNDGPRNPWQVG